MTTSHSPLFLGFDLSTQQLKAIVISEDLSIIHESAVHFDRDLSGYESSNGALRGPDEGEVTSPVRMWLGAIDLLMQRVKSAGVDSSLIVGISGAGQEGSIDSFPNSSNTARCTGLKRWRKRLASMDLKRSLAEPGYLAPLAFALPNAPIWQGSSTTKDFCDPEATIGDPQVLADLTGSRTYERFAGPQIARHPLDSSVEPDAHRRSARISLDDLLLEACGGSELRAKIGPQPVPGGTVLGRISNWWVERCVHRRQPRNWGYHPADAPPKRFTTSHHLSHPTTIEAEIAMLCYKNDALVREQIRDRDANRDWEKYNELVKSAPVGENSPAAVRLASGDDEDV
ncbi:hypothetical protein BS17DRAFT_822219 [Gyrodon lividus]|nr:hypothetical protein BS17DRAFT_822219 [Gyrodon lividus]